MLTAWLEWGESTHPLKRDMTFTADDWRMAGHGCLRDFGTPAHQ